MQRETYDKCGKSVDKSFHKEDKDGSCEDKEKMSFHQVKVQQLPVEIKKMLMNISLKGITFPSACIAYSDSDIISPARNAPRARERPARELIHAIERPITTMLPRFPLPRNELCYT
jgi:hypothetical protein